MKSAEQRITFESLQEASGVPMGTIKRNYHILKDMQDQLKIQDQNHG
ncbi:MAG: hypothetical protein HOD60_08860 [Candidatus Nitrosopelagicus sp.]|nr:hypothetical protein [Candidatus Nitrosopelagicus sp.]